MNEHLHWRYTTKKFDPARVIPPEEFSFLLEVLRLAPSSYGLQPWKFVIVRQPHIREKLKEYSWGQSQVTEASHLLVFCARTRIDDQYIRKHIEHIAKIRNVSVDSLKNYEKGMQNFVVSQTPQELADWIKRQVYIPLGMLVAECAHRKIDASPIEGFEVAKVDALLGLPDEGVTSLAFCALGYRAADDRYAGLQRVRFEATDVFIDR
ncbi:MAG: NAD(P)H-dependent oxidoreductase [Candidatus Omnitrophica bacterium]|nr:NAD(P)H-dependent oxidoreductase [Candidatus Omnitrophota bacterium]